MNDSQSSEPPLPLLSASRGFGLFWRQTTQVLAEIPVFIKVLIGRVLGYVAFTVNLMNTGVSWVFKWVTRFKKSVVRLLMYRGGFFYQTPRLGLTAVVSTTAFSMLLMPALAPIGEQQSINLFLAQNDAPRVLPSDLGVVLASNTEVTVVETGESMRREVLEYTVQPGDTLSTIAEDHLVSIEAIKYVNDLTSDLIRPGDTIEIPPVGGLVHQVEEGDSISSIASLYNVSAQAIVDFNHLEEPFTIRAGDELVIPDAQIPVQQPVVLAQAGQSTAPNAGLTLETIASPQTGTGGFIMPTTGTITQYFWWGHTAIDIAAACGTPIVAADSGTIVYAQWWPGGGGNSIFIDHGNGYVTKYAHMSGFAKTGGGVSRGEVIGYMGATGRAFGCHVHFIVEYGGRPVNPLSVL